MKETIMDIASLIINGYVFCIFYYVIASWIPALRENFVGKFVAKIVEPYLALFRFIPPIGMIDISAVVAIFAYNFLSGFLLIGLNEVLGYFM